MSYPPFFDRVPRLTVQDPLSALLGAAPQGIIEYGYPDAVRLAGHSCPTVATAYVLGHRALGLLYPGAVPERGGVCVDFADHLEAGVTGVSASILTLLTGAAAEGGFKGLGGRFARRGLLRFGVAMPLMLRLTRIDNGAAVDAGADTARVPSDPALPGLMDACLKGADADACSRFAELWQGRVKRLLINHWDDPQVFTLNPL